MSATAIIIVLVSAIIHASWNLVGKYSRPKPVFFMIASCTGFFVLVPFAIAWRSTLIEIPSTVWVLLIPAGFFQMLYFVGLAGAYQTGDMSVAYPIARAVPVIAVPVVLLVFGRGESLSLSGLLGMLTVAVGVVVVTQPAFMRFSWGSFNTRWFAFAILAGIGTTGYSIVDDTALREFRSILGQPNEKLRAPVLYVMLESLATTVSILLSRLLVRGLRGTLSEIRTVAARAAILSGVGIVLAYGLALVALGFVSNVSYVVAFRQMSLPIGAFLAIVLLRERVSATRVVGTTVLLCGLVVVAFS